MKRYYRIVQFACALVIFLSWSSVTAINCPRIARESDAPVLTVIFGLIILLSAILVLLAGNELKQKKNGKEF
jgi:heme/copper-type cytochrome/quinol oxidase subunit 3